MQCRGWLQYRGRRLLICIMQCRGLTMKVRHYWLWRLEAEHWGHRLNEYGGYRLKGSVSRDYLPQFLQNSNPSGPLINSLNSEVFSHSVSISPRSQSFLKIQISQRNRKRIWKCGMNINMEGGCIGLIQTGRQFCCATLYILEGETYLSSFFKNEMRNERNFLDVSKF